MFAKDISLVIFCKRPAPGQGKQRLAASVGRTAAFQVAEALLDCVLEDAAQWPGTVVLSPASESDAEWAAGQAGGNYKVVPQSEGNLGERILAVDAQLRDEGHHRIVYIGSDAPEHNQEVYERLAVLMSDHDVVLTPAGDGGVTAMGSAVGWGELETLPWSTDQLGMALKRQSESAGLSVGCTPVCYDVDQLSDLQRLQKTLRDDPRPARQTLLRITGQLLEEHDGWK
ncbi:TIGR04282 family arsenosugar biosynthesis glycosyltransferase [Aliamphritea hakodatensis]|uniref:TIGR04282 family arsenosugar biosynthesis glycosyltransferase n=1 Tax=Aliamphritea hakodatensis TaxID=2895352 RepID=UPI0022FD8AF2|nr:DUF2064 domain-containing protein [Aliamphritea hakodatensis]